MKKLFILFASILLTSFLIGCSNFNLLNKNSKDCTVTFVTEYGKTPKALHVEKGSVLTDKQLKDLEYEPMIFVGWFLGEKQIRSYEYKITKDITLTAKWDYPFTTFQISYDSDYGTAPIPRYERENTIITAAMLPELSAPDNTFLGWYDGKTLVKAGEYKLTKDVCFEAKWEKSSNPPANPPASPTITGMWKPADDSMRMGFLDDKTAYISTPIPEFSMTYYLRGTYTMTDTTITMYMTYASMDFVNWEELSEEERYTIIAAYTLNNDSLSFSPEGEDSMSLTKYSSNTEDLRY